MDILVLELAIIIIVSMMLGWKLKDIYTTMRLKKVHKDAYKSILTKEHEIRLAKIK